MKDWGKKTKTKKWIRRMKEKRNVMGWRKTKKDINGNDFQGEKERFKERFKERKWKCMSRMFVGKEREMQIGNEWMIIWNNQPTN